MADLTHSQARDAQEQQIQDAVRRALRDQAELLEHPFGKPTAVQRADCVAKLGNTTLVDPTGGALAVTLQKTTRSDRGKLAVVKNASPSTNTITIQAPTSLGDVDGASSTTITTAREPKRLQCVGEDAWICL